MALVSVLRYLEESQERENSSAALEKRPQFLEEQHLFDEIPCRRDDEWSRPVAVKKRSPAKNPGNHCESLANNRQRLHKRSRDESLPELTCHEDSASQNLTDLVKLITPGSRFGKPTQPSEKISNGESQTTPRAPSSRNRLRLIKRPRDESVPGRPVQNTTPPASPITITITDSPDIGDIGHEDLRDATGTITNNSLNSAPAAEESDMENWTEAQIQCYYAHSFSVGDLQTAATTTCRPVNQVYLYTLLQKGMLHAGLTHWNHVL
ncbi:uncharacterized protein LOC126396253 [Epinephelus moara]|uniref:uncharacterized protein LOC126396253 n=1 Tax=Epinephelus moara TaxID=300413 RepID=UPI00214ECB19|nr:uncharacterized protein LOC126396253 [Epinephelus moara]